MGPSDTAGQPVSVVEHEPTSAMPNGSSSATGEPKTTEESSPALGHASKSVESKPITVADGDSALGSVSETPEASCAAGPGPEMEDEPLDVDVRLVTPSSNVHTDVY
jgi:hypothetical protein